MDCLGAVSITNCWKCVCNHLKADTGLPADVELVRVVDNVGYLAGLDRVALFVFAGESKDDGT